jgi:hypothetical protein
MKAMTKPTILVVGRNGLATHCLTMSSQVLKSYRANIMSKQKCRVICGDWKPGVKDAQGREIRDFACEKDGHVIYRDTSRKRLEAMMPKIAETHPDECNFRFYIELY